MTQKGVVFESRIGRNKGPTMYQTIYHGPPWLIQCTKMFTMVNYAHVLPKKVMFIFMNSQKIVNVHAICISLTHVGNNSEIATIARKMATQ